MMFSQGSLFFTRSFQESFSDDFELDLGSVLGARSAHILLFGRPGGQLHACFLEVSFRASFFV